DSYPNAMATWGNGFRPPSASSFSGAQSVSSLSVAIARASAMTTLLTPTSTWMKPISRLARRRMVAMYCLGSKTSTPDCLKTSHGAPTPFSNKPSKTQAAGPSLSGFYQLWKTSTMRPVCDASPDSCQLFLDTSPWFYTVLVSNAKPAGKEGYHGSE